MPLPIVVQVLGDNKSVDAALAKTQTKVNQFNSGLKQVGIGLGAAAVAAKVAGFLEDSVGAASNLNEQVSKSQVLFGKNALAVQDFGDTTSRAFGISKREALEAAGNFGNLFNTIGLAKDEAAQMSSGLVALAGDLASMNDLSTSDALEKLRSGLAGEAEPLRTVGVLINETAVAAEAQALGFRKVNGAFTEGQKVQARYSLILKQTSVAQGDFARTGEGVANQARTLNGLLEDTQDKIGNKLLPQVQKLQRALIDAEPAVGGLIDVFPFLIDSAEHAGNIMGALGDFQRDQAIAAIQTAAAAKVEGQAFEESFRRSEHAANRLTDGLANTRQAAGAVFDGIRQAARDADGAIQPLIDDMTTLLFGNVSREGREAGITGQIKDLQKELKTTKDKGDAAVIKGQIADLRTELFNLHFEEAESKGPKALLDWFSKEEDSAKALNKKYRDMISNLRALADIAGKLPPTIWSPDTHVGGGGRGPGGPGGPGFGDQHINIYTAADPSAVVRAIRSWARDNGGPEMVFRGARG